MVSFVGNGFPFFADAGSSMILSSAAQLQVQGGLPFSTRLTNGNYAQFGILGSYQDISDAEERAQIFGPSVDQFIKQSGHSGTSIERAFSLDDDRYGLILSNGDARYHLFYDGNRWIYRRLWDERHYLSPLKREELPQIEEKLMGNLPPVIRNKRSPEQWHLGLSEMNIDETMLFGDEQLRHLLLSGLIVASRDGLAELVLALAYTAHLNQNNTDKMILTEIALAVPFMAKRFGQLQYPPHTDLNHLLYSANHLKLVGRHDGEELAFIVDYNADDTGQIIANSGQPL